MTQIKVFTLVIPGSNPKPDTARLKIFWETTRKWTDAEIAGYQAAVPALAEQIRTEQYWSKDGKLNTNRFTCEDFPVRVLVQYAASRGLPVKLVDGARTYRNMEVYGLPEHERYDSTLYGFADMVELTYGAPDMQRTNVNTIRLEQESELKPGDMLVLSKDLKGRLAHGTAHHIQLVMSASNTDIAVYQGDADDTIHKPMTWFDKLVGRDAADPQSSGYAGTRIETGAFQKINGKWNYRNATTGFAATDFLKYFEFYRWNFLEFNN